MKNAKSFIRGDKIIWVVLILLSLISLIEVYSSIGKFAYDTGKFAQNIDLSTFFLLFKHFAIICATYLVIVFISHINYQKFEQLASVGYIISIILLAAALILYISGYSSKAAGRWIEIPFLGQLQPSEIAKYLLILFMARFLANSQDTIKEKKTFWIALGIIALVACPIFPQNLSTAGIIAVCCFIMMFLGNINKKYWIILAGIAATIFVIGLNTLGEQYGTGTLKKDEVMRTATWGGRISEWLNDDLEANTQRNIALRAIAMGGLTGNHPGSTIQGRLLSESHNDFIYAIIIEELGSIGGLLILLLYTILFYRCVVIAGKSNNLFKILTVSGLGLSIYLQALINMGVAVGYLPVTGQTLPFISYGGTSYLLSGCAVGVIQSIAHSNKLLNKNNKALEEETEKNINDNDKNQ